MEDIKIYTSMIIRILSIYLGLMLARYLQGSFPVTEFSTDEQFLFISLFVFFEVIDIKKSIRELEKKNKDDGDK